MAKQKRDQPENDAPEKPKRTEEEKLHLRRERAAAEQVKIEAASNALADKAVAREKLEAELRDEEIAVALVSADLFAMQGTAADIRADLRTHERNVRRLEFALGLRKRGQAPVEAHANEPEVPQEATSVQDAVAEEAGLDGN